MVHLDPIPTPPDTQATIQAYLQHRSAFLWYVDLAAQTGLRLSAQMTGVYAEACVRQGDALDFTLFTPGGTHHLGTHLHANVKRAAPYLWRSLPQSAYADPDSVRRVLSDNIPWLNDVFYENGATSADNWFFHGTHASYPGMEDDLWCLDDHGSLPFDNCYTMAGATRGAFWVHLGGFALEPEHTSDTTYVKLPEVGGIIGYDQEHGPEGMVYGTVPYQKRDFLRVYLEWREAVRRDERSAIRFFNWMIHPYQLLPGSIGTDGRSARESIAELVGWLNENFIERADESGLVTARFANAAEIRSAYEAWRSAYPAEGAALQATLQAGDRPLYLPAIHDRLQTVFYNSSETGPDPDLVIHRCTDHESGQAVYLAWSRSGSRPLEPALIGEFLVLHGDGDQEVLPSSEIWIGEEPVILEEAGVASGPPAAEPTFLRLEPIRPTPLRGTGCIRFSLSRPSPVELTLCDVGGRRVALLRADRLAAGDHAVALDTRAMGSGVYWCRLDAGGASIARPVLIVR